jgi:hypothetical protein
MARHAALRVSRIGLKSAGAAALVARRIVEPDGVVLGIVPAGEAIEFVAIERGQLVFSRRAEPTAGEASADAPARAALEAKRTWMSYRSSPDSGSVSGAVVLGDDESARQTAARCAEALEMPCRAAGLPEEVSLPAHAMEDAAAVMLAGLLLEDAAGSANVDLSRAARPSRSAVRRRQAAMLCVLGLIVGVGGLFSWGAVQKRAALDELESLREQRSALAGDRLRALRDLARLDHVRRWESTGPAWTAHLAALVETMPGADRAIIDDLSGTATIRSIVTYKPRSRTAEYDSKAWSVNAPVSFVVDGRAVNLGAVEELREAFVSSRAYDVQPLGQDGLSAKDDRYPAAFSMSIQAINAAAPAGTGGTP